MQLFHFSARGDIDRFDPRPVAVAAPRKPGFAWLNGPLVWAIDAWHQPLYLFPRDCPRILLWPTAASTAADCATWLGEGSPRMAAYLETAWFECFQRAQLFRYRLPATGFESLDDAGMWVSREAAMPTEVVPVADLGAALAAAEVDLRVVDSLAPLRAALASSLHVSAIRLRNSATWPAS